MATDGDSEVPPLLLRLQELRGDKVTIQAQNMGAAPIMKDPKFLLRSSKKFADLVTLLKRQLKLETLHVYCCGAFEPDPDESVGDLFNCFAIGNPPALRVSYSLQPAVK
mmetsp:Transcript_62483/g.116111  ORF Transcript_62483/g.116111 Transcript_62483/m.116111 type:complete len:109 (+) Transcript_62483:56-382(+)